MAIQNVAFKAYSNALDIGQKLQSTGKAAGSLKGSEKSASFAKTIEDSLGKVNSLQTEKASMVEAFASGEQQNVHELMITLQKAGLAMNMTSAVRGKVMEAYKELMHIQF